MEGEREKGGVNRVNKGRDEFREGCEGVEVIGRDLVSHEGGRREVDRKLCQQTGIIQRCITGIWP